MSVVSVSWPTADMRGIALVDAARTTTSSLNAQRSSKPPPPRATMRRSGRGHRSSPCLSTGGSALSPAMARAISSAAPSPCTRTGQTRMWSTSRSERR